jgi:WhiB family redox-sensing transcriptional regulator
LVTVTDAEIRWLLSGDQADPLQWLAELTRRPSWHAEAACRGAGADVFVIGRGANAATMDRARAVCSRCPVTVQCLDFALADPDAMGIWSGTTGRERKQMRTGLVA